VDSIVADGCKSYCLFLKNSVLHASIQRCSIAWPTDFCGAEPPPSLAETAQTTRGTADSPTCSTRYKDQALTTPTRPFRFLEGSHFTEDACCDLCGDFTSDGCQLWSLNTTGCALYFKVPLDRKAAAGTTVGTLDKSPPGPLRCPVPGKSPGSYCDLKATPDACPSSCPCARCPFSDPACGCKSLKNE
jgi:hypothetical protein